MFFFGDKVFNNVGDCDRWNLLFGLEAEERRDGIG